MINFLLNSYFEVGMRTIRLSSKGQIVIPKEMRSSYHWEVGQELVIYDAGDGLVIKTKQPFPKTSLEEVAGCLRYKGKPKTLREMEEGIRKGARELMREID